MNHPMNSATAVSGLGMTEMGLAIHIINGCRNIELLSQGAGSCNEPTHNRQGSTILSQLWCKFGMQGVCVLSLIHI